MMITLIQFSRMNVKFITDKHK